ncbi:hypothetical protein BJY01DRAFT_256024 [Aspergillus pseudoustus]|uniref:Uncharacterized protein n=1 Tax=Aspergillus pseudoustus TaxID=1810923 RepID=A0ABR4IF13_9EURO
MSTEDPQPTDSFVDAEYLTIYLGACDTANSKRVNTYFLVLATPDFTNSTYSRILAPYEARPRGKSLVYHRQRFRLPTDETGLWEKVLEMVATMIWKAETAPRPTSVKWDHAFVHALEAEQMVAQGTLEEYQRKQERHAKAAAATASRGEQGHVEMADGGPVELESEDASGNTADAAK